MGLEIAAVLAVFAAVLVLTAGLILRNRQAEQRAFMKNATDSWGSRLPRLYLSEQIRGIRRLADAPDDTPGLLREGTSAIDAVTEADLQLDKVFGRISRCQSQPGEEVLYEELLHPAVDWAVHERRAALRRCFDAPAGDGAEDPQTGAATRKRLLLQRDLARLRKTPGGSYYSVLSELHEARPIGRRRYIFLALLTIGLLILLFVHPLAAVLLMVPDFFLNIFVHLRMKRETGRAMEGLSCILGMLHFADSLKSARPGASGPAAGAEASEADRVCSEIVHLAASFAGFRREAALVITGDSVGTGLGDAVLEYLRMLFHPDLICYDRMLEAVRNRREELTRLLVLIGSLDAAVSAASFRASLPVFCEPEPVSLEGRVSLHAEGLYHPLLEQPVPNSITADKSLLLTGSNASGKSTFLRTAALAVLLGQSIGVVPASSFRAPFFRLTSSMALTDDLLRGKSYFMVEIGALKRIFDTAGAEGAPVLAAVDEVLRGTNTIERVAASSQILRALAERGGVLVFAATHDLELTELLWDCYDNKHFGEVFDGEDVHFDYLLKEGRADERNAIRLLRAAGFPEETTAAAEACAVHFEKTGQWTG